MIGILGYIHLFDELMELAIRQGLYKAVCNHLVYRNIWEIDYLWNHLVTDIVVLDIDMLSLWMEDWIVGQY